jgi:hypothetical protein
MQVNSALMSGEVFLDQFRNHHMAITAAASLLKRDWQGPEATWRQFEQTVEEMGRYLEQLNLWVQRDLEQVTPVNMLSLVERARDRLVYGQDRVDIQGCGDNITPLVHGLPSLLLAVVEKLIHSSLSATDARKGTTFVKVKVGPDPDGPTDSRMRVIIRIEDDAERSSEEAATLFLLPADQAGRSRSKHDQLDLPLCSAFLALHEGRVSYQAATDGGREAFEISLPLATDLLMLPKDSHEWRCDV